MSCLKLTSAFPSLTLTDWPQATKQRCELGCIKLMHKVSLIKNQTSCSLIEVLYGTKYYGACFMSQTALNRRCPIFALLTSFSHISVRIFLLFTFLLWHSLSSTYFCCTQLSFSQFSPGITQPQLSLTLHNFATHTSALAYFCLSSVFYLKL